MPTNLRPASTLSAVVLPATGTHSDVASDLAYGIYNNSSFVSGAVDQVAYVYNKLGGNILDLEITPKNVYNAYEEACLEYSYLINTHQAKNVLSDLMGNTTGSFDEDGEFSEYSGSGGIDSNPNLKFPRFQLGYSASLEADVPFYNKVGKNAITIQKVFYKTPRASWRFFGGRQVGAVGNLSTYGMYADDSTFQLVPAWQNVLQAYAYEEDMNVRASHYSFEINNNKLRIFPLPDGDQPSKFWVKFRVSEDAYDEDSDRKYGADGVNNMNTLPFPNVPYNKINSIGKQWIRRFALSLSKETLGQVRSKLGSIPIPGNDVTLNGSALISEAKEEQSSLRDELKSVLDELVYGKLAEGDAALQASVNETLGKIPHGIYVG